MPRKSNGGPYPADWPDIAHRIKQEAGWKCVRCGHAHEPETGYTLTVHHMDLNPANCAWWNCIPLCQRCHLSIQARVDLNRPWVMLPHSDWFRPYVAGFYAWKYAGEDLSREEVEARLDELLSLELQAMGMAS